MGSDVVPKRRHGITNLRCVISQKNGDRILLLLLSLLLLTPDELFILLWFVLYGFFLWYLCNVFYYSVLYDRSGVYGSNFIATAADSMTAAVLDATECTVGSSFIKKSKFHIFLSTFLTQLRTSPWPLN